MSHCNLIHLEQGDFENRVKTMTRNNSIVTLTFAKAICVHVLFSRLGVFGFSRREPDLLGQNLRPGCQLRFTLSALRNATRNFRNRKGRCWQEAVSLVLRFMSSKHEAIFERLGELTNDGNSKLEEPPPPKKTTKRINVFLAVALFICVQMDFFYNCQTNFSLLILIFLIANVRL